MASKLKDVAEELGVSISTVSRVANGDDRVSPKMQEKVTRALRKYNYVPNQIARSLKAQNTRTVGIIVPDIREYFANVIKNAESILYDRGYVIILADTGENVEKEERYLRHLSERNVDGLILATVSDSDRHILPYFESNKPIVFFDNLPNLSVPYNSVLLDNYMASRMVVDHLVREGHRKIAVISGPQTETTSKERMGGFLAAMAEHGLEVDNALLLTTKFEDGGGCRCMNELIERRDGHDFSAVYVTCNQEITSEALRTIWDRGLRCPEDIALVGFDFEDSRRLITPEITSIIQPIPTIGKDVANRLIELMTPQDDASTESAMPRKIILPPVLKVGGSSRYCRSGER